MLPCVQPIDDAHPDLRVKAGVTPVCWHCSCLVFVVHTASVYPLWVTLTEVAELLQKACLGCNTHGYRLKPVERPCLW